MYSIEKTTTAFSFVSQHWLSNSRLRNSFGSLHFFMPSCFNEKKHNVLTQNYVDVAIISKNLADWRLKPALNLQEIHFKSSISQPRSQLFTTLKTDLFSKDKWGLCIYQVS